MERQRPKKPVPSEWTIFFASVVALITIGAPTFWFAQSSWRYSHMLFIVWPIVSALAWLYLLDGYEGEWSWGD
jgi:hypothetical protein